MKLKTVCSTWYEAIQVGGYGCKLADTYRNKREAQAAIKAANEKAVAAGYSPDEYYIVICNATRVITENCDIVSETVTRAVV